MFKIFFGPYGRNSRQDFLIGLIGLVIFSVIGNWFIGSLGISMTHFYLAPIFWGLTIYMAYCVFGRRLHDIGRSVGPFMALLALLVVILIVVMLTFGGAEYFAEFSQYDRKAEIDPSVSEQIIEKYKDQLARGNKIAGWSMWAAIATFCVWLGFANGEPRANNYGDVPHK